MKQDRYVFEAINPFTYARIPEREIRGSHYFVAKPGERYAIRLQIEKLTENIIDNYLKVQIRIDDNLVYNERVKPESSFFIYVDSIRVQNKVLNFTWAQRATLSDVQHAVSLSNENAGRIEAKVWKGKFVDGEAPLIQSSVSPEKEKNSNPQSNIFTAFVERFDDSKIHYDEESPPDATLVAYYHTAEILDLMALNPRGPGNPSSVGSGGACCIIL